MTKPLKKDYDAIKICLEGQECGNAASASQAAATAPVEVKKVELSEGSEHIVKMFNTGDGGQMIFEPVVIKSQKETLYILKQTHHIIQQLFKE